MVLLRFAHITNGSQNISARFRSDSLQLLMSNWILLLDFIIQSDGKSFTKSGSVLRLNLVIH